LETVSALHPTIGGIPRHARPLNKQKNIHFLPPGAAGPWDEFICVFAGGVPSGADIIPAQVDESRQSAQPKNSPLCTLPVR